MRWGLVAVSASVRPKPIKWVHPIIASFSVTKASKCTFSLGTKTEVLSFEQGLEMIGRSLLSASR